jgi:hypothetical protein
MAERTADRRTIGLDMLTEHVAATHEPALSKAQESEA